jgi:hypothetical protein
VQLSGALAHENCTEQSSVAPLLLGSLLAQFVTVAGQPTSSPSLACYVNCSCVSSESITVLVSLCVPSLVVAVIVTKFALFVTIKLSKLLQPRCCYPVLLPMGIVLIKPLPPRCCYPVRLPMGIVLSKPFQLIHMTSSNPIILYYIHMT